MPTTVERSRKSRLHQHEELKAEIEELEDKLAALHDKLREFKATEPPKLILPELHDRKTGRIDAQKVADYLAVPLKRLADGLGLNYKAVHRDSDAESWQETLKPVKRTLEYLHSFYPKPAHQRIWLNTPHPMLDGRTPLETSLGRKAFATERLLGNAWEGVWS